MESTVSPPDRLTLLALARRAVVAQVAGSVPPTIPEAPQLYRRAGAFVTLTRSGVLRGCIGYPEPDRPLAVVVAGCAAAAASTDPRFIPVSVEELSDIHIEISVLTPLEPVVSVEEIIVGRHGLVVEQGSHRGLLLPQVASDWQWDRETFLSRACLKAGLRPNAWQTGALVFRFEAEVFDEESPG